LTSPIISINDVFYTAIDPAFFIIKSIKYEQIIWNDVTPTIVEISVIVFVACPLISVLFEDKFFRIALQISCSSDSDNFS